MNFFAQVIANFKKMHTLSVSILYYGLELASGLAVIAFLFYLLIGNYGNPWLDYSFSTAALDTAKSLAILSLAGMFISDLAIRDRTSDRT